MRNNITLTPNDNFAANSSSFYWASRFLGSKTVEQVAELYGFCRSLDDLADGNIVNNGDRLKNMRSDILFDRASIDPLLSSFQPFIERRGLPKSVLIEFMNGFLCDQVDSLSIPTENDLIRYAYRVAGTVGLLMCKILNCSNHNAYYFAIDLGIGMQLTNIARDVLEDARMGRRYLPGDWLEQLNPEQICAAAERPGGKNAITVKGAIKRLLKLADKYYASSSRGFIYLAPRIHFSISIAAKVYHQIGIQLADCDYAWHEGRQVTSSYSKLCCSLIALTSFFSRIVPPAVLNHDASLHEALKGLPYAH